MTKYKSVVFEISGICNAKCPYCCNGNGSASPKGPGHFISPDMFQKIIDKLIKEQMISKKTMINLYNWGEPLLHPHLNELENHLLKNGLSYGISTNGSTYKKLQKPDYLAISTPGFSQKSYDKIHQFQFEKIRENIEKYATDLDPSRIEVKYFIYKFNLDEIESAKKYYGELGVNFRIYLPYFNDGPEMIKYMSGKMDSERVAQATSDMFIDTFEFIRPLLKTINPPTCTFLKKEQLTIDETGNLLRCCTLNRNVSDYALGEILSLSATEIEQLQNSTSDTCRQCLRVLNPDVFYSKWDMAMPASFQYLIGDSYHPGSIHEAIGLQKTLIRDGMRFIKKRFT